jgi:hypothetical protein
LHALRNTLLLLLLLVLTSNSCCGKAHAHCLKLLLSCLHYSCQLLHLLGPLQHCLSLC